MRNLSFYQGKVLGGWVEYNGIGTLLKLVVNKPGKSKSTIGQRFYRENRIKLVKGGRDV